MSTEAYPLSWPPGWPRARTRESSQFSSGRVKFDRSRGARMEPAQQNLFRELGLLGAKRIVLSTNIELRQDGLPYANRRDPTDPGVAIYFELKRENKCFPCDRWDRVADNVHAIALSIGALRGLDRWGASHMVDAAFKGFRALPEGPQWWQLLGLDSDVTSPEEIKAAYKKKAKTAHPDMEGGSHEEMIRIEAAYQTDREMAGE